MNYPLIHSIHKIFLWYLLSGKESRIKSWAYVSSSKHLSFLGSNDYMTNLPEVKQLSLIIQILKDTTLKYI